MVPTDPHQRMPSIFGSRSEVELIHRHHQDYVEGRDSDNYDVPPFGNRLLFRRE